MSLGTLLLAATPPMRADNVARVEGPSPLTISFGFMVAQGRVNAEAPPYAVTLDFTDMRLVLNRSRKKEQ